MENDENLHWLQAQHLSEPVQLVIQESWGIETFSKNNVSGYRFYPHKTKGEGFFLSVLKKKDPQPESRFKLKQSLITPSKKIAGTLEFWLKNKVELIEHRNRIHAMPRDTINHITLLTEHLNVLSAGTPLASVKHDKIIPEHAAALSIHLDQTQWQRIDVNRETALRYLRKESIEPGTLSKGFALVVYNGLPLGWVNVLDNRVNNLYPKEWRIRMAG
jgi:NOL1/NOP2/fmu family ribosome biogenesis protein